MIQNAIQVIAVGIEIPMDMGQNYHTYDSFFLHISLAAEIDNSSLVKLSRNVRRWKIYILGILYL